MTSTGYITKLFPSQKSKTVFEKSLKRVPKKFKKEYLQSQEMARKV